MVILLVAGLVQLGPPAGPQEVDPASAPSPGAQPSPLHTADLPAEEPADEECDRLAEELARILVDIAADNDETAGLVEGGAPFHIDPDRGRHAEELLDRLRELGCSADLVRIEQRARRLADERWGGDGPYRRYQAMFFTMVVAGDLMTPPSVQPMPLPSPRPTVSFTPDPDAMRSPSPHAGHGWGTPTPTPGMPRGR